MYLDSGGVEKDEVATILDRKLAAKGGNLLRSTIDDVEGIHNKLQR